MMRRLLYFILLLAITVSCSKDETPGYNPPAVASQTVLVYMAGCQLSAYYTQNIADIRKTVTANVPGKARILVCYQPQQDKATLYEIYYDTDKRTGAMWTLKEYDSFDSSEVADVSQLFTDARAFAPARRYGLIIGSHGKAWVPASSGYLTSYALGDRPAERDEDLWQPLPDMPDVRSFGDPSYEMDIPQLSEALAAQNYKFDYLLFDACFMANIETIYDLRNSVKYFISSPSEVAGRGFPYDRILPCLFSSAGSFYDLKQVCTEYYEFFNTKHTSPTGCISLTVMSHIDSLAAIMARINAAGPMSYDASALQTYEGMSRHLFFDLQHYVESICSDPELLSEFQTTFDAAFPSSCRLHTERFLSVYNGQMNPISHYSGVSVSEPSVKYTTANRQTAWYLATHSMN